MIKENLLGKYQIDIEMKNKTPIPKNLFSLKITNTKNKINESFCSLNSFENLFLKPENGKKLAQKILAKIPKKWGLYRPNRKLAVRLIWQPDRLAVGQPADRQRS